MLSPLMWAAYVFLAVLWLCGVGPIVAAPAWLIFFPLVVLAAWALFWLVCWVFGWGVILFFLFLDVLFG